MSLATGALFPDECQTWKCPVCGPRRGRRVAKAIERAGYERFCTLTKLPRDGRQAVARCASRIRRGGYRFEWAWTVEAGGVSGMVHVHAVQRGDYVPQAFLSRCASEAGFGPVSDIRAALAGQAHYSGKAWYSAKMGAEAFSEWLTLNGGHRCWHTSRGYTGGQPFREFVSEHARGSDPGPFVRYGAGLGFEQRPALPPLRLDAPRFEEPAAWQGSLLDGPP